LNSKTTRTFPTSNISDFKADELDTHPLKTETVTERSDFLLYLERSETDGNIFYEEDPLYQDNKQSIQLIAKSVQHWSTTADSSILLREYPNKQK
tara:strand:+ start:54 stop:338 length:285 start_codon:yes stop_codon:yes gene_type:complete